MQKIRIDENLKNDILEKFKEYLTNTKFTDARLTFSTDLSPSIKCPDNQRPTIFITATAYLKMMLYVRDTNTEIAWHGTVTRNTEENWYMINDVFLYPQTISAATVNTDQEKYQNWLQDIEDDDVYNAIRFQGHSHVHMGVTPSSTDMQMYNDFLQVLPHNDFYIFTIMNKSGCMTWFIYDLEKNTIYETDDIDIQVFDADDDSITMHIDEEKTKYCTTQTTYYPNGSCGTRNPFNYLETDYDPYPERTKTNKPTTSNVHVFSSQKEVDDYLDEIEEKYKNKTIKTKKGSKK